jgi:hypothetical protein
MRSGGSVEQSREPTNRNRIQGEVAQGERAFDREALSAKESSRRSGGCAVKVTVSYLGRSRFMPERATQIERSEKSAEAVVASSESPLAKGRTEGRAKPL